MGWFNVFCLCALALLMGFFIGLATETDMYKAQYKECIKDLPRSQDCKQVGIKFIIINTDK